MTLEAISLLLAQLSSLHAKTPLPSIVVKQCKYFVVFDVFSNKYMNKRIISMELFVELRRMAILRLPLSPISAAMATGEQVVIQGVPRLRPSQ